MTRFAENIIIDVTNNLLGKDIEAKYVPNTIKNYVPETLADTSKAKKILGFKAEVKLEDGIKKLVEGTD